MGLIYRNGAPHDRHFFTITAPRSPGTGGLLEPFFVESGQCALIAALTWPDIPPQPWRLSGKLDGESGKWTENRV